MFENVAVKNFRCFIDVRFGPLSRINLIAGKNNTGKTALLEAIHLLNNPSDCMLPVSINKLRGIAEPGQAISEVCNWLFHDRKAAGGLEVAASDDKGLTHTLSMWVLEPEEVRERFPRAEEILQQSLQENTWGGNQPRLVMRYQQPGAPERFSIAVWKGVAGLSWVSARLPWTIPSVYLGSAGLPSDQDIKFFGEVEASKRQEDVLKGLRIVEPRLQKLALLPMEKEVLIHGDIGLSRMLPIAFMGEGIRRLLSLLLAISNAPGGVVLIDEIENGLHHSVLPKVWQAIGEASQRADVQVFATTHSYHCIDAGFDAFKDENDFRLHRLERAGKDVKAVTYNREALGSALKFNMEVR